MSDRRTPLLKRRHPVAARALLELLTHPVGARHLAPASWHPATAFHPEAVGAGHGAVVEGGFLSSGGFASCRDLEWPDDPQSRVTAVVAEVDRGIRRKDEVLFRVQGDRVDLRSGPVSLSALNQLSELR